MSEAQALHKPVRVGARGWTVLRETVDGYLYANATLGLAVIVSAARELDGRLWKHVSVSRRDRHLPSWENLVLVKDTFCGAGATALQVIPPRTRHINLAEVLHLFECLDGPVTPDFTRGGDTL